MAKIICSTSTLWQKSELPSTYQQVEWIHAPDSYGCYIDLGFAFDTKAKIYLSHYITGATSANYGYIFGAAENSGKLRCMLTSPYSGASVYGSTDSGYITTATSIQEDAFNDFEMTFKKGELSITNATTGKTKSITTQAEYTMQNNLYLFAQNYNGSARFGYHRKVRYFQYYDKNDELVCDLIPCYRKSDNVIGMYDVVRNIFLTNAGNGSFTKGANV